MSPVHDNRQKEPAIKALSSEKAAPADPVSDSTASFNWHAPQHRAPVEPPREQTSSAVQRSVAIMNNAQFGQRSKFITQMQKAQGNHFASQVVQGMWHPANTVQRDAANAAPAAAAAATWSPPFDLPSVSKKYEAGLRLLQMSQQLEDLKESMGDLDQTQIDGAIGGLKTLIKEMKSEDALTTDDVNKLTIVSSYAKSAADSGRQALTALISQAIQSMLSADTGAADNIGKDLDEELRKAFLVRKDPNRITQIKSVMDAIGKYKGQADKVADWAKKANGLLNSAKLKEFLEAFGKRSKQLGDGKKYVEQVLNAAKVINGLMSDQGPGQAANDIAKFEAAIDGIDIVMGFAKAVPGLGQLWSGYYKPLTDACIKHIKYILRLQDEEKRDLTLFAWMTDKGKGRGPDGVPIIPPELSSAFPGENIKIAQSVLNYMYPLVNGGQAVMIPDVEQFFIKHKGLFNAGADKGDEIDTEWHLFKKDTSPNLIPWITRNANTVWALLYGNMQKNI